MFGYFILFHLSISLFIYLFIYFFFFFFKLRNCLTQKHPVPHVTGGFHYCDVIMGEIASQITSLTIVYSIIYSDAVQRKHQSSASLAFVRGIHRGPVNSPHKWPVTRKMFPFDDVIMFVRDKCHNKSEEKKRHNNSELSVKRIVMNIFSSSLPVPEVMTKIYSWRPVTTKLASWQILVFKVIIKRGD